MDITPLPRQREAIEAPLGPVLVVAGPGAGKTFCLISRVEHLIRERGITPARVCAVTFTNKAAEEIAVRLGRTLGGGAEEITRSTLHALCLRLLRERADLIGLARGFGVADEPYQRAILGRLGVPSKRRSQVLNYFSRRRSQDFKLSDITRGTAYFRNIRGAEMFDLWLAHRNLRFLPVVRAQADICRDELSFEIELDAISTSISP